MKFVSAAALREEESLAIAAQPGLGLEMMRQAGNGLAERIVILLRHIDPLWPKIRFLAGPGNNGGDAFTAAICLDAMGFEVDVWLAVPTAKLKGDAAAAYRGLTAQGICVREVTEGQWGQIGASVPPPTILVDALLGTGATGEPRGNIRLAVEYLNQMADQCVVVAADVPTGLDAETGAVAACCVRADFTVTMELPKVGMAASSAREFLGSLWQVPVGLPRGAAYSIPDATPDLQWISTGDVRRSLPRRARVSHKGTYGTALLLGGSAHYPGAIVLAAEGAIRSGAGLLRVATVESAAAAVRARVPEVIVDADLFTDFDLAGYHSILLGPGLGRKPEVRRLVERLLRETTCPLVLDADAIAVLASTPEAIRHCTAPVVLTPHPGELALLLGTDAATVQQDRVAAAREAVERTGALVVLKGAGTLVVQTGQPHWINLNGNQGMACGGSGDVLAGLLAGLLAQGIAPLDAACAAVWLHGTAGDIAALRNTQFAMKAGDIADALPIAFHMVAK